MRLNYGELSALKNMDEAKFLIKKAILHIETVVKECEGQDNDDNFKALIKANNLYSEICGIVTILKTK